MSEYQATLHWQRGEQPFTDRRYSRRHLMHFDGGAVVPGSSSPHSVRVPYSDPAAVDPEEAFVASLSSCHMLWFLDIAARRGLTVDRYTDEASGVMANNAAGKLAMTVVTLHPRVVFAGAAPSETELHALHQQAHERCFIASSVLTEVRCEPVLA